MRVIAGEASVATSQRDVVDMRRVLKVLTQAKLIARQYYRLTKKPLGITGEIAELEAHRLLGVALCPPRQPGFDATEVVNGLTRKLQIKGRCLQNGLTPGQRLGGIRSAKGWDAVLMVLLDAEFNATEIWEASRAEIEKALDVPGSRGRNERRALAVAQFKRIGRLRWPAQR